MNEKLSAKDVIMSKDLAIVEKKTNIKEISKIMVVTGFQRIPVVDGDILVSLITQSCIIRAVADTL